MKNKSLSGDHIIPVFSCIIAMQNNSYVCLLLIRLKWWEPCLTFAVDVTRRRHLALKPQVSCQKPHSRNDVLWRALSTCFSLFTDHVSNSLVRWLTLTLPASDWLDDLNIADCVSFRRWEINSSIDTQPARPCHTRWILWQTTIHSNVHYW